VTFERWLLGAYLKKFWEFSENMLTSPAWCGILYVVLGGGSLRENLDN
jgi:hypothetical protein